VTVRRTNFWRIGPRRGSEKAVQGGRSQHPMNQDPMNLPTFYTLLKLQQAEKFDRGARIFQCSISGQLSGLKRAKLTHSEEAVIAFVEGRSPPVVNGRKIRAYGNPDTKSGERGTSPWAVYKGV